METTSIADRRIEAANYWFAQMDRALQHATEYRLKAVAYQNGELDHNLTEVAAHPQLEVDPFEDDTPLTCGLEDPDYCDTCQ